MMNEMLYIILGIGLFFQTMGTLALHRFPDVYTRMHGATKCTTFGSMFLYIGVMVYSVLKYFSGDTVYLSMTLHTFIVMILILLTNPTGAHAIARAAYRSGVKPVKASVDMLKGAKL